MKTMMKWLIGISCAVAFIAIAFTPSNAAAQYACRPVSRIGPQSIEGPLTLTCTSCAPAINISGVASGSNAITIPTNSRLMLSSGNGYLYAPDQYGVNAPGNFSVSAGLYVGTTSDFRGALNNGGATNGGSLAFNDPTRWLSTTTALLESSTTATAGTDTAFTLNSLNSLEAVDKLLSVQNGTSESFSVYASGAVVASGNITASDAYVWAVQARQAGNPIIVRGNISDGATAIGTKVGNVNSLSTDGSKILSLYSDNLTTERAYFDYLGGLHFVTTRWDDLLVPMSTAKAAGVRAPGFEYFKKDAGGTSTGVFGYAFDSAATEELFFTAQLPHSYKEGTAIKPHVHWSPTTADAGNVKFALECTKATIDGTFAATSTITATAAASGQLKHQLTTLTDISGTGLGISSVIMCRIARLGGDSADTYGFDVFIHGVDFHYEIDSVGSSTSTAK